jgi:carboxyl-terminal processing protease
MMPRLRALPLALLLLSPLGSAARGDAPTAVATDAAIFDEVWQKTDEKFYDPHFNGHDWAEIGARYRPLALAAPSVGERAAIINRMLGELGASHIGYYTRADQAYYDLADIFSGALRRALPRFFPNGEVAYIGIGAVTERVGEKNFVIALFAGFPGEKAGLEVGDEIIAADGAPFDPIGSFDGKAGQMVTLSVRRAVDGPPFNMTVTPQRIRPNEAYEKAIEASARIIETNGQKIGYIRMYSYARWAFQRVLERAISIGVLKDADALVWDLRDGWGGAQPSYLDIFEARGPTMTVIARDGETEIENPRWRKPVVLLVNGGSRSGKEVLAYGFKKYGVGPVVGTRTKGEVLAASAYLLSDGSLLELPVEDVRVDGERLEGVGVAPTVEVPFDPTYAAGADPQLKRAVEIAAQALHG